MADAIPVRKSVRKTRGKTRWEIRAEKQKTLENCCMSEIEEGLKIHNFPEKGRGIVASKGFEKGDFVVEYRGDLITLEEAEIRETKYAQDENIGCYMYYFKYNDVQYCLDATTESGYLGRLINHSRNGNLLPRPFSVDGKPRLVFIAKDDIAPGEEVSYDYGDRSKDSLKYHPWLAS